MKSLLPFTVIAYLLLIGCGKTQEDVAMPMIQTRPTPTIVQCSKENPCASTGNCFHSPFEGERQISTSALEGFTDSGYFQKSIQRSLSNSIMNLSGEATWNTVIRWGVPVFKVATETSANPCRYYAPLKIAPLDLQKKWQGFIHKSAGRGLLGLFTSQTFRNGSGDVSLVDPAILVREDSERWTLVHEIHHYLFARARVNQRPYEFDSEILLKIEDQTKLLQRQRRRFENGPTEKLGKMLLNSYRKIFEWNLELDKRGPLEEFAIESQLLENWSQNFLTLIHPEFDLRNAVAYMSSNQSRILDNYKRLRKSAKDLSTLSKEKSWPTQSEAQSLTKEIRELIQFINGKMEVAYGISYSQGSGQTSDIPRRPPVDGFEILSAPKSHYDPDVYNQRDLIMSDLQ